MLHENTGNEEAPPQASPPHESPADHGRTSHSACFRDVCCADADSQSDASAARKKTASATSEQDTLQRLNIF